jgi:tetratricopeptide (TPR) repeat protein
MRLAAAVGAPLLCFLLLEIALRLGGYGFDPSLFLVEDGWATTNPAFSRQCFPPSLARSPIPARLPHPKPDGVYRIVVVGESAAQGFPFAAFSFGRILEVMLRDRYPGVEFEVVNGGVTAVNSHVLLPMTRDAADLDADAIVIYAGNNEVVGPYGPGTIFVGFSSSLGLIRTGLALQRLRVGQLVSAVVRESQPPPGAWEGLASLGDDPVAADDPRLEVSYRHFRHNLADMIDAARDRGAAVVASTVAVNLADCPPFVSLHRDDLSDAERAEWESLYREGIAFEEQGRLAEAEGQYRSAARIDDRHAELHFRLARCLAAQGRADEALASYRLARDLDALRLRADSRINDAIRELTRGREDEGVHLVDSERALARPGSDEAHDSTLFEDHVHLTFDGNYAVARSVFEGLSRVLPEAIRERRRADGGIPSRSRCARLLAFTDFDRRVGLQILRELLERPPFTRQIDADERVARLRGEMQSLASRMTPDALREYVAVYETAITTDADDVWLRVNFAQLLGNLGNDERALEELRAAEEVDPTHSQVLWMIARTLGRTGELEEEATYLGRFLDAEPYNVPARLRMAANLEARELTAEAADSYRKLVDDFPDNAQAHVALGVLLARRDEWDAAERHLRRAIELEPTSLEARLRYGLVLHGAGRAADATAFYRQLLAEDPDRPSARFLVGLGLLWEGKSAEAAAAFEEELVGGRGSSLAAERLAWILAADPDPSLRNGSRALELAFAANRASPRHPAMLDVLAAAWAEVGSFDRATASARLGLQLLDAAGPRGEARKAGLASRLALYESQQPFRGAPPDLPVPD